MSSVELLTGYARRDSGSEGLTQHNNMVFFHTADAIDDLNIEKRRTYARQS